MLKLTIYKTENLRDVSGLPCYFYYLIIKFYILFLYHISSLFHFFDFHVCLVGYTSGTSIPYYGGGGAFMILL